MDLLSELVLSVPFQGGVPECRCVELLSKLALKVSLSLGAWNFSASGR